jgi:hypothetical protein
MPLAFVAYAAFKVVHELTFNRPHVPTMATTAAGQKKITALLQTDAAAHAGKTYNVIDLGSGRGELSRRIALNVSQTLVTGLEIARIPFLHATLIQRCCGPANLTFKRADFWLFDCTTANAVLLYLTPRLAQEAGKKLEKELAPGCLVISYTFPLQGQWRPIEKIEFRAPFKEVIYVYRKSLA